MKTSISVNIDCVRFPSTEPAPPNDFFPCPSPKYCPQQVLGVLDPGHLFLVQLGFPDSRCWKVFCGFWTWDIPSAVHRHKIPSPKYCRCLGTLGASLRLPEATFDGTRPTVEASGPPGQAGPRASARAVSRRISLSSKTALVLFKVGSALQQKGGFDLRLGFAFAEIRQLPSHWWFGLVV